MIRSRLLPLALLVLTVAAFATYVAATRADARPDCAIAWNDDDALATEPLPVRRGTVRCD